MNEGCRMNRTSEAAFETRIEAVLLVNGIPVVTLKL